MSVKNKVTLSTGKRKTSIARVIIKNGKGRVRVNNKPLPLVEPILIREKIMEPLMLAANYVKNVDIKVKVHGGGVMSQATATRMGIAQGLLKHTESNELREIFIEYDRTMLAGDPRRKEPKKFGGPGARRRKQKSYR
jgi:small subunit ribosomal protein S9